VQHARELIEAIGLQGQRLQMIHLSSAMAGQFAFAAAEIAAEVSRMGPSPLRGNGAGGQDRPSEEEHRQEDDVLNS
jgi:coenzyme F420-reducing hydrogenase delta subunit